MASIEVTPLTATIAARVDGLDLAKPLSNRDAEAVRQALAAHSVLVFHDQHIDLEQHKTFTRIFGLLEPTLPHKFLGRNEAYVVVIDTKKGEAVKAAKNPDTFLLSHEFPEWHADATFCAKMPSVACLRAEVIPPVGGGTSWASLGEAYDALSAPMQQWLEGLGAVHAAPTGWRATVPLEQYSQEVRDAFDKEFAARVHPIVVRHPITGRKQLFVNPYYCVRVEGLSNAESAMLLRFLYTHITQSEFVFRQMWRPGDVVVWDELATLHHGPTGMGPHERRVVRITAGLTEPRAASANFREQAIAA